MAAARKAKKADSVMDAAIDYFSGRSHDAWRKTLRQTTPEHRGQPRLRRRGGVMVDINQPWSKLDRRAKDDNKRAARDAPNHVVLVHVMAPDDAGLRIHGHLCATEIRTSTTSPTALSDICALARWAAPRRHRAAKCPFNLGTCPASCGEVPFIR